MSAERETTSAETDYLTAEDRAELQQLLGPAPFGTNRAVQAWANRLVHRVTTSSPAD